MPAPIVNQKQLLGSPAFLNPVGGSANNIFVVGMAQRIGPVLSLFENPNIEGVYSGSASSFYDRTWVSPFPGGGKYRLYVRGGRPLPDSAPAPYVTLYFESRDGKKWIRPVLNRFGPNNVLMQSDDKDHSSNLMVAKDPWPGCPPNELYKGIGGNGPPCGYISSDGLTFTRVNGFATGGSLINDATLPVYDSQPSWWRDMRTGKFWIGYRDYTPSNFRTIRVASADNFAGPYTSGGQITGTPSFEHLYDTDIFNAHFAPDQATGTVKKFVNRPTDLMNVPIEGISLVIGSGSSAIVPLTSGFLSAFPNTNFDQTELPVVYPSGWRDDLGSESNTPAVGMFPYEDGMGLIVVENIFRTTIQMVLYKLRKDGLLGVMDNPEHYGDVGFCNVRTRVHIPVGDRWRVNSKSFSATAITTIAEMDNAGIEIPSRGADDNDGFYGDNDCRLMEWHNHATDTFSKDTLRDGLETQLQIRTNKTIIYSIEPGYFRELTVTVTLPGGAPLLQGMVKVRDVGTDEEPGSNEQWWKDIDADKRAVFGLKQDTPLEVTVEVPGYATHVSTATLTGDLDLTHDVLLELAVPQPGAPVDLAFTVVDDVEAPVQGVAILIADAAGHTATGVTDVSGDTTISVSSDLTYTWTASKAGFASASGTVTPSANAAISATLRDLESCAVTFTCEDAGVPAPGCAITAQLVDENVRTASGLQSRKSLSGVTGSDGKLTLRFLRGDAIIAGDPRYEVRIVSVDGVEMSHFRASAPALSACSASQLIFTLFSD